MNIWKCMCTTITLYVLMYTLTNEIILKDQKIRFLMTNESVLHTNLHFHHVSKTVPKLNRSHYNQISCLQYCTLWHRYRAVYTVQQNPASSNRYSMSIGWGKRAKKPSEEKKFESSLRLALMHPRRCSQRQECISLSIDAIHQTPLIFRVKMLR